MPTPDQVRTAINALNRVRAVEKPAEADGTREVWHQAALDVDLLSVVDAEGKLTQQELTLFADVIHWSRRGGLRTGRATDPSLPEPVSGDGTVFDPSLVPERLQRTHAALSEYTGKDNYLIHLRDLLAAAVAGRQWNEQRVISKVADSQPIVISSRPSAVALIGYGAGAVFAIALLIALWLNRG